MLFRLAAVHYINDVLVPEGTLVGKGTPWEISGPSMFMDPVDDEAKAAYEKHMEKWKGKRPPAEILSPPGDLKPGQKIGVEWPPSDKPPPPPSGMAEGGGGKPLPGQEVKVPSNPPKGPEGTPLGTPIKGD
jgi:hypothetical protein